MGAVSVSRPERSSVPERCIGEHAVAHDVPAVHHHLLDPLRPGVQTTGAAGEVELHAHLVAPDRFGIEDDDIGVGALLDAARGRAGRRASPARR